MLLAFLLVSCLPADSGDSDTGEGKTFACAFPDAPAAWAGEGATDCGEVAIDGDATATDACTITAWSAGEAFYAVYRQEGIDSAVARAWASDGTTLWGMGYDSDPSGGGGTGAVVWTSTCVDPYVTAGDDGHDVLACTDHTDGEDICEE